MRARELAVQLVASGADLVAAVEHGFAAGIRRVGELWEEGEYFLPELVQGAEAMKAAMAIVLPALAASRAGELSRGRVVLGTVKGDLHDIGQGAPTPATLLIGGAPTSPQWAASFGATHAENALRAVAAAEGLLR